MPFNKEETRSTVPTSIGALKLVIVRGYGLVIPELQGDPDTLMDAALFENLAVRDQNKDVMNWREGNLVPHLTPQEINGLQALMDRLWGKAEDEILP